MSGLVELRGLIKVMEVTHEEGWAGGGEVEGVVGAVLHSGLQQELLRQPSIVPRRALHPDGSARSLARGAVPRRLRLT